jgi:peptide-methionine (S)-S-oxide reductase
MTQPRQLCPVAPLRVVLAALPLLAVLACGPLAPAAEAPAVLPAPAIDNPKQPGRPQTAVLAGGCFWGLQGVFEHVRGVRGVFAGYSGGSRSKADYQDVETGSTGHAESVQVTFDPGEITYGEVLQIFFSVAHDPTELNRQGPDTGTQYRSVIFFSDDTQKRIAETYISQLTRAKSFPRRIVTQLEPLQGFYKAEDYHQDYYLKNPDAPYIVINDLPKIRNLETLYPGYYSRSPASGGVMWLSD